MDPTELAVDPDHIEQKQRDLAEAKSIVVGDAPKMEQPDDGKVSLTFGLLNGDDYETEAEVRELNGADEEALAKFTNMVDLADAILSRAVVRIGSVVLSDLPPSERQTTLGPLLAGDRELLFLGIIATTYGDKREVPFVCPHCEMQNEVDVIISEDFKPEVKEPIKPTYEFTTSKGEVIVYRLANGFDQLSLSRKKGLTVAQANSSILHDCILSVDGMPPFSPMEFVLNMGMKDRRELLARMEDAQPGVDMGLSLNCPNCGEDVKLLVSWEDIFRL